MQTKEHQLLSPLTGIFINAIIFCMIVIVDFLSVFYKLCTFLNIYSKLIHILVTNVDIDIDNYIVI